MCATVGDLYSCQVADDGLEHLVQARMQVDRSEVFCVTLEGDLSVAKVVARHDELAG